MTFRRHIATLTLLLGIGAASLFLGGDPKVGVSFTSPAHAQNFLKNLIARLRGQSLPKATPQNKCFNLEPREGGA